MSEKSKKWIECAEYSRYEWSWMVSFDEDGDAKWDKELFECSVELRKAEALENISDMLNEIDERLIEIVDVLRRPDLVKRVPDDVKAYRQEASRKRAEEVYRRSLRSNPPTGGTRIVDADLSVRAVKAARQLGFTTVEEFAAVSEDELAELPNCGATTIQEIREMLAERGLSFRTDTDVDAE